MAIKMAYLTMTILFFIVTLTAAENSVKTTRDITKEFDELKKFVASKMEAMEESYTRDIQGLKDVIDTQGKIIQKLEAENVIKNVKIQELQQKVEDLSVQHSDVFANTGNTLGDSVSKQPEGSVTNEGVTKTNTILRKRGEQSFDSGESRIAFFATMTNTISHLGKNQDIIFDNAVTNIGNGYLPHHGTFVAPVTGTYVFSVTLVNSVQDKTWVHFVVNGSIVAKLFLAASSSQVIVVYVRKGEDVSVQNTVLDSAIAGDRYSSFSGFILYEDNSVNQIVG